MKKINGKIQIVGRRWFQKSCGNTYHSVKVYVNDEILEERFVYGYGNQYIQTGLDLLKENGYEPVEYGEFEKMDCTVTDVKRKKDL